MSSLLVVYMYIFPLGFLVFVFLIILQIFVSQFQDPEIGEQYLVAGSERNVCGLPAPRGSPKFFLL